MGQVQWHFPAIGYVCLTMISTRFIHPFNYIAIFILAKCRNSYYVNNSEINGVLPVSSHKLIKNFHCVCMQWKYQGLLTILVSNVCFPKGSSQPIPCSSLFHPYLCFLPNELSVKASKSPFAHTFPCFVKLLCTEILQYLWKKKYCVIQLSFSLLSAHQSLYIFLVS